MNPFLFKILVLANNSSDPISGNISDVLETLDGVKGYKGDVTITDEVTLEQLTKLNKATTGAITLNVPLDFVGTSTEILTAIAGDINSTGNIVITNNNYTLAQLNAISEAGTIKLSNASVALSGSVDDLSVLSGISDYAGAITVTGNYNLADLEAIDGFTTGKINVANKSVALEGAAANLAAMLPNLAGYKGAVTVLDAPTVAQLKAINNATAGSITLEDQSGDLSGSAADILAAFKGIKSYEGDIQVTGTDYKLADLKAINAITKGDLTVTTSTVALTGSAKDLAAALDGVTTYAGKVTVTGSYTVADLIDINAAVVDPNDLVLANKKVALTGTAANIKLALAGISDYEGAIKLTDVPADTAELISVANLTKGKITLPANGHIDLDATAEVLQPLLAKINGAYKGDVTVSALDVADAVKALAQLKAINDATTGDVEVTAASDLEGSIKDIHAALKGIKGFTADVTVTDTKYTLAQLKTIVDSGVTSIDLDVNAPLSGSVEDLTAVLAVATGYEGDITVTGTYTLAQLKALGTANGDGAIKVANTSVALKGSADDLEIVLSQLKGYKGAVTVTDALDDLDQLLDINNGTTGKITLEGTLATTLSGEASDILAAFKGIKSYEGAITVTGTDYKLADLKAINAITEGAFTVATPIALSGNAKDLAAALNGVNGVVGYGDKVTVTGSYTVADLKDINAAVTGDVVLANKKVALTGTAADIKLALAGISDYEGAIKVTDSSISATDLKAINNLTKGKITLPANGHDELSGTVSEVTAALQEVTGYKGTVTVTVDGGTTLAQLQTILKSTVVKAEFNTTLPATTTATTLEGTAKEITAVLNKFSTQYNGNLTVTGSYKLADLVALDKALGASTGVVTLDNDVNLSGKSADIAAALSNVTGYAGKITLTDKPTLAQLVAINAATTEAIKIPTDLALSGTTADVKAALVGIEGYKGNVNLTDSASAADLNTIAGLTTGVVKATLAATTPITDATVTALANVKTSDIITLNSTVTEADATALIALNALVDTKSYAALTKITEVSTTENLVTVITNALAIKPNVAVEITGPISAADLNTIANLTNGVVTATLAATTPITDATVIALANVDANDVISLTSSVTSADATALVALAAKVSTADTTAFSSVTTITEVAGQVGSNGQNVVDALTIAGNDAAVTITGAISAAQLNAIAGTLGTVTATLAANTTIDDTTVTTTLANVDASDVISLTSSVTSADATALVALAAKVSTADTTAFSSVTTITEVAGQVGSNGQNVVDALTIAGNDTAVTITGGISAESVAAINTATNGLVTVSEVDVTAATFSLANLGDLTGITGLTTIDASGAGDTLMTITAADLFAANDSLGNLSFTISGTNGGNDSVNLIGWTEVTANTQYTIVGNFDGVDGDETYTVNLVDTTAII